MKIIKIFFLLTIVLTIIWCKTKTKNQEKSWPLINVKEKIQKVEKELTSIWLTWEELKQEIKRQKHIYEQIANLTWEAKNNYILQNKVLPKLRKTQNARLCKDTKEINNFTKCMTLRWIEMKNLIKKIPEGQRKEFKKIYYKNFYSKPENLLKKTQQPLAIKYKKYNLLNILKNNIITKKEHCNQFPEKEIIEYCKNYFKWD